MNIELWFILRLSSFMRLVWCHDAMPKTLDRWCYALELESNPFFPFFLYPSSLWVAAVGTGFCIRKPLSGEALLSSLLLIQEPAFSITDSLLLHLIRTSRPIHRPHLPLLKHIWVIPFQVLQWFVIQDENSVFTSIHKNCKQFYYIVTTVVSYTVCDLNSTG